MAAALPRTDEEIAQIYRRQVRTVYRVCFAYMKNPADTEDAVQETFYRMIRSGAAFDDPQPSVGGARHPQEKIRR